MRLTASTRRRKLNIEDCNAMFVIYSILTNLKNSDIESDYYESIEQYVALLEKQYFDISGVNFRQITRRYVGDISDADEFYDKDQFKVAKEMINEKGWPITYWSYVNYYRDFEHYLVYPFRPFVPGIHSTFFNYTFNGPAPGPTDPTRRILNPMNIGTHIFDDEVIRMGHGAWIRKDIRKKLINWSAKDHFTPELIDVAVKRWENWKEGDDAIMLFNVPENSVKVRKLETKIHKFEVPWLKNKEAK